MALGYDARGCCCIVIPHYKQGFWKGVVPSLVMVANPTVQYVLYEAIMARRSAARKRARGGTHA